MPSVSAPGGSERLALRCAVHPSRAAHDTCPVCTQPRCDADAAAAPGGGCLACEGRRTRAGAPPMDLASLAGAACLCNVTAVVAGMVASEYVGAGWVGWVVPAFAGVAVAIAAEAGARKHRGVALRVLAAAYSVLAVAVGLHDPRAAASPFTPVLRVAGLYAIAAAASWVWTAPPRVVPRAEP
jgi:hypothetical protein